MATVKDIAKIVGVSTATVSNVLNGRIGAAGPAKTREIFEVAESLHYRPNSLAKSLKQQKTNSIGVITEDLTVFNTPEIVDGIDEYCEENNYEIILANMRLFKRYNNDFTDTPKHQQLFNMMISNMAAKQVEGIIYVGYHSREVTYLPSRINVPFVYAYCYPKEQIYSSVLFNDEVAAYKVTKLLLKKKHKKIGVISGPRLNITAQWRLRGYQRALHEQNIPYNEMIVCYGEWDRENGYRHTDELIDAGVTAIFAFSDRIAGGVYKRCLEKGITIGKDVSLFGYDNIDWCEGYTPPLSSVAPPLNEMGRKSAELVFTQIKQQKMPSMAECKPILLNCEIYERASITSLL
ncbi:LacI family transcriptional regulator [Sporanaerobium hydrogeniformans]|uniref:LacI family transcriptional regulator n=1 Tax=Sporanaerobium hydrogeniformans TaxID=3072179 RepID=A0AC61D8G2_9FIRM|nr:LacI family DNA-binding transcriptional regulator [Sporanaerobium hydrogeniformans]PHV69630.1 LacI family transcriptional regulator [Sporanaerobium hydrogeniformans]